MKAIASLSLALAVFAQTCIVTFAIHYDGLVLTSIDVKPAGSTDNPNRVTFSESIQGSASDTTATFLKNVKQINEKDEDGKPLFEGETISVREAKKIINEASSDGGKGKPLFCIHGFNVTPGSHLKECQEQCKNKFNKGKFTLVPVIWPSKGGITNYGGDQGTSPGAGRAFKTLKRGIDSFPGKSLLSHSMGNYVLRHAADGKFKFDNIFMAAADVRYDLFHETYIRGKGDGEQKDGLRICSMLAKNLLGNRKGKVYVMTNGADFALNFSGWTPRNWIARLGAIGNAQERLWYGGWKTVDSLTDPEIKDCIENKSCNPLLSLTQKASHSYQFMDFTVKFYQDKCV